MGGRARGQYFATSTLGAWSCHVQNTETLSVPEVNSTLIHVESFHTCTDQPAAGVADTSVAESLPRSNTARPPCVV